MNKKWLDKQTEEIGSALAGQGIRLAVPVRHSSVRKSEVAVGKKHISSYIDHTLLDPTASRRQIRQLCLEAGVHRFASVCVHPGHVFLARELLEDTEVKVCTVIGFPLGATTTLTKVAETRDAVANGAEEVDLVLNLGSLLELDYAAVYSDLKAVRDAASKQILKVILETGYLSKEEIVQGCILSKMAGADFVKTCTGFGPGKANLADVALMREVTGPAFGVKASGGIRDYAAAKAMIEAGANRLGTSSGVAIAEGAGEESSY